MIRSGIAGVEAVSARSRHGFPRHTHGRFGVGVIECEAHRSLSGRDMVEAGPGDIITVNPGEVHDGMSIGGAGRSWRMLYIDPALVAAILCDMSEGRTAGIEFSHPVVQDARGARRFRGLFSALTQERRYIEARRPTVDAPQLRRRLRGAGGRSSPLPSASPPPGALQAMVRDAAGRAGRKEPQGTGAWPWRPLLPQAPCALAHRRRRRAGAEQAPAAARPALRPCCSRPGQVRRGEGQERLSEGACRVSAADAAKARPCRPEVESVRREAGLPGRSRRPGTEQPGRAWSRRPNSSHGGAPITSYMVRRFGCLERSQWSAVATCGSDR